MLMKGDQMKKLQKIKVKKVLEECLMVLNKKLNKSLNQNKTKPNNKHMIITTMN